MATQLPCLESLSAGPERSQRLSLLLILRSSIVSETMSAPGPLATPAPVPGLWPERLEPKLSQDLALESVAAPCQRGPARDQSAVGRWPGIRADTSRRHRSRRWQARAPAKRPAGRVFFAGLAGRTTRRRKRPGRQIRRPVDLALVCPVLNFSVPILPVPLSPVPQEQGRRKVLLGARVSDLPKQLEPKTTPTKRMPRKDQTADSTWEQPVWHRFRLKRNASSS